MNECCAERESEWDPGEEQIPDEETGRGLTDPIHPHHEQPDAARRVLDCVLAGT